MGGLIKGGLTFRHSRNLSCAAAESLWAWWCLWSVEVNKRRYITWQFSLILNESASCPYLKARTQSFLPHFGHVTMWLRKGLRGGFHGEKKFTGKLFSPQLHLGKARVNVRFCIYWLWHATVSTYLCVFSMFTFDNSFTLGHTQIKPAISSPNSSRK